MRTAHPVLFPGEFCGVCPLTQCAEANTDAACSGGRRNQNTIHPGNWSVLEQRIAWAPTAVGILGDMDVPPLPAYMPRVPREVDPAALETLPTTAVALSLHDFMLLTSRKADAAPLRDHLRLGRRALVVIGADHDRTCDAYWCNWKTVARRLADNPPDLIVGPDLSFYEEDSAAARLVNFNSHTAMYVDLVKLGLPTLVPFGWVYRSDVDRFVAWATEWSVPGAFVDLQRRTPVSAFHAVVRDLAAMADRFPPGFTWLVNGVQRPERMRMLHKVLGDVRFTSAGPWQKARSGHVFAADSLQVQPTGLSVADAFSQSVRAMTAAAQPALQLHSSDPSAATRGYRRGLQPARPAGR